MQVLNCYNTQVRPTVVSQPNMKMVMTSLESRDLVASNSDLAMVMARFWVLKRNSKPDNILCVSPSVLSIKYCQRAPDTSQPEVKMASCSISKAN